MSDFKIVFNGYNVTLYQNGVTVKSWDAVSGRAGFQSPVQTSLQNTGPIPSGNWTLDTSAIQTITVLDDAVGTFVSKPVQALTSYKVGRYPGGSVAWGLERVDLVPEPGTETFGRSLFTLHGGDSYGSAGCIDLGHGEVDFFKTITDLGISRLPLEVSYDNRLLNEPHPLAGEFLGTGPTSRGLVPVDHLGRQIGLSRCFLSGTAITINDGCLQLIEKIKVGDIVASYEHTAQSSIEFRKVAKVFQNTSNAIIDLRGLFVTPGHVFLTKDLNDYTQFATIASILRSDRTVVDENGIVVRARTGAKLCTDDDRLIPVVYRDNPTAGRLAEERHAVVRAGIPLPATKLSDSTVSVPKNTFARHLESAGVSILSNGCLRTSNGTQYAACNWPAGSTPFDTPEARNWIVEADGQPYTPPWIRDLVEEDEAQGLRVVGAMPTVAGSVPTIPAPL